MVPPAARWPVILCCVDETQQCLMPQRPAQAAGTAAPQPRVLWTCSIPHVSPVAAPTRPSPPAPLAPLSSAEHHRSDPPPSVLPPSPRHTRPARPVPDDKVTCTPAMSSRRTKRPNLVSQYVMSWLWECACVWVCACLPVSPSWWHGVIRMCVVVQQRRVCRRGAGLMVPSVL